MSIFPSPCRLGRCCGSAEGPTCLLYITPAPPGDFLLETTNLRAAARAEVEGALKRFLSPQRVLLRDKLTWCCGTLSMVGAAYWLGHSPQ